MPYTTPTADELQARHTKFASVADATIDAYITEANRTVDETWLEDDYQPAIMYLAAHLMVMEGVLGGKVDTAGLITSRKLGDASVTYGKAMADNLNISDYGATAYGRRYQDLLRRNHPAVVTA